MRTLEKEFISNIDSCGDHRFIQLKRSDKFAVYVRKKLDGTIFAYEVFKIKVVKAGTKSFSGAIVEEDYESYPTKHSFGKTAKFYYAGGRQLNENILFDNYVKENSPLDESEIGNTNNTINVPSGLFNVKILMKSNPGLNYIDCYQYIKSEIDKTIEFVEARASDTGRGKPSNYYKKK